MATSSCSTDSPRACAQHPEAFADTSALARSCGVSQTKLGDLFRNHAHLAPAAWLRRERVRAACEALLAGEDRVVDVGYAAGFESESVFHRQFLIWTRMTPGGFRALRDASVFLLQLPAGYRAQEILAYHDRDRESPCERVDGHRIFKALLLPEGAVVLEVSLEGEGAWCRVHPERALSRESMARLHASALRMLGLSGEVTGFETRMARAPQTARFFARRKGHARAADPDRLRRAVLGDHRPADQHSLRRRAAPRNSQSCWREGRRACAPIRHRRASPTWARPR